MSDEYLGDIAGPADDGRASGLGPVLAAVAAISADLGRLRATVDHLGVEHARTTRLVDQLKGLPTRVEELQRLAAGVPDLAEELQQLADQLHQLLASPKDQPLRPVDWTHVPVGLRAEWLADLLAWVRDVLFAGWPWTTHQLRACWPRHPELINDLALVRSLYQQAYDHSSGRTHHAVEFRRTLADVMRQADALTAACPQHGPALANHLVPLPPRDDADHGRMAVRVLVLGELYQLTQQANDPGQPLDFRAAAAGRAKELFTAHGIAQQEYLDYERALSTSRARAEEASRPTPGARPG